MEKIMAVITREKQFSERLCDYVNKKNDLVLTAIPFENMGACASFSENHRLYQAFGRASDPAAEGSAGSGVPSTA